jgi:hypothetical protein
MMVTVLTIIIYDHNMFLVHDADAINTHKKFVSCLHEFRLHPTPLNVRLGQKCSRTVQITREKSYILYGPSRLNSLIKTYF